MAYIFGLILLSILAVVLHFFTELNMKQKGGVVVALGLIILLAYLFNLSSEKRRVHLENVLLEYTHGKTIVCEEIEVNNTIYSYSSGTQTFLGKKGTSAYGRIISLDQCQ